MLKHPIRQAILNSGLHICFLCDSRTRTYCDQLENLVDDLSVKIESFLIDPTTKRNVTDVLMHEWDSAESPLSYTDETWVVIGSIIDDGRELDEEPPPSEGEGDDQDQDGDQGDESDESGEDSEDGEDGDGDESDESGEDGDDGDDEGAGDGDSEDEATEGDADSGSEGDDEGDDGQGDADGGDGHGDDDQEDREGYGNPAHDWDYVDQDGERRNHEGRIEVEYEEVWVKGRGWVRQPVKRGF